MQIQIVSWNIHRCFGSDGRHAPERIAAVLKSLNADIIALQEVDSSLRVAGEIDQLSFLANELGMKAIMGPTLKRDYGAYGNAVLSRFPVCNAEEYDLSYRKFEPRGALGVEFELGLSQRLRVVNAHLGLRYWERAFQLDQILSEIVWPNSDCLDQPAVLLGDFNEWFPFTGNGLRLKRNFREISRRTPTFPSSWPRFSLDRICVSGEVSQFSSRVEAGTAARTASDHLPLVATFRLSVAASVSSMAEQSASVCR